MNYFSFSLLLLSLSANSLAMEMTTLDKIKAYNEGSRKTDLAFKRESVILNKKETAFSDATFLEVVDSIVFLANEQYNYLESFWKEGSATSEEEYAKLVSACCAGMKLLKNDLISKLYDRYVIQPIFWKYKKYTQDFFKRVLKLLEKYHNLRMKVCKKWEKDFSPELAPNVHISKAEENNFGAYANVLQAKVDVAGYFKRMRSNDIK